ncbi:MAG TPA: LytTR family DNA-binding domain-containing protein [Longimicrobium sp.]|nr:LytTR family DNA-binding domain-containing protein [Longimicrobium sp.]
MDEPISVLIADDEPPARKGIRALLELHADVRVVGEARSGREAIEAIQALQPELVFLDVQMPEGDGFEVIRAVGVERMPVVVFATAYDAYALQAFEAHALDYLLKPYERERFDAVLQRARARVRQARGAGAEPRLLSFVRRMEERSAHLRRLPVRVGSRVRLVDVDEVAYFEAETNYVRVHLPGASHLVRDTLGALEAKLDPARFLRVHRSLIVNLERIVEVEPLFAGEHVLTLRDGTRLTTGRTYRARVQEALGLR